MGIISIACLYVHMVGYVLCIKIYVFDFNKLCIYLDCGVLFLKDEWRKLGVNIFP